jgi:hypothetical protein
MIIGAFFRDYSTYIAVASAQQGTNLESVMEKYSKILSTICRN